ncbi:hypothetical protein [Halarcobacter sp.]|uniref:hypothetical protein n=1 Tax=Halarcobacter sp. TaxID=2321133 RepID=UPI002AA68ABF|nr:hypothetical protein [Halarcobacter sp.]
MQEELTKEAYKIRFEYFNIYENKENKWHEKYKNHRLYSLVVKSLKYNYKEIGLMMPKLIEEEIFLN